MKLNVLIGSGHKIVLFTLPFLAVGLTLNTLRPSLFAVRALRGVLRALAVTMLIVGVAAWIWSAVLILVKVPRQHLATSGPYALVKHPLYTAFGLLVLPGIGLLLGSWLGVLIGVVLYMGSRRFSPEEESELAETFGDEWDEYCGRVKLPWL
jgi:protein-S-isoprenylcysteine O-methyltransferase Ste14